jgi:hypothetical protein
MMICCFRTTPRALEAGIGLHAPPLQELRIGVSQHLSGSRVCTDLEGQISLCAVMAV